MSSPTCLRGAHPALAADRLCHRIEPCSNIDVRQPIHSASARRDPVPASAPTAHRYAAPHQRGHSLNPASHPSAMCSCTRIPKPLHPAYRTATAAHRARPYLQAFWHQGLLHADHAIHPGRHGTAQRIGRRQPALAKDGSAYRCIPIDDAAQGRLQPPHLRTLIDRSPRRVTSGGAMPPPENSAVSRTFTTTIRSPRTIYLALVVEFAHGRRAHPAHRRRLRIDSCPLLTLWISAHSPSSESCSPRESPAPHASKKPAKPIITECSCVPSRSHQRRSASSTARLVDRRPLSSAPAPISTIAGRRSSCAVDFLREARAAGTAGHRASPTLQTVVRFGHNTPFTARREIDCIRDSIHEQPHHEEVPSETGRI